MNLTTEKPILFNTEMVKAILAGQKTSTRRVTKFKPYTSLNETNGDFEICEPITQNFFKCRDNFIRWAISKCRYKVGDILYVRETFCSNYFDDSFQNRNAYKADYDKSKVGDCVPEPKWRPSIHMPKEVARIFLKVTDVKVQQIQDITEDEAKAEGATPQIWYQPYGTKDEGEQRYIGDIVRQEINYVTGFAHIWDKTVNKKEYAFQSNPWVWAIEFQKLDNYKIYLSIYTDNTLNK